MPGERTAGGLCLVNNPVTFLFETQHDLLWQRARLPERDEVSAAFALQVRQHAPRMESGDKITFVVRFRHVRSAGVPACELWRRPAASSGDTHRDGA